MAAACVAAALSGGNAEAAQTVLTLSATSNDTGVVDTNADGYAEWNSYGATNNGLNVGEQAGDGWDMRYVAPFSVTPEARAALGKGGTASLQFRVWTVAGLGLQTFAGKGPDKLEVDLLAGGLEGKADYNRAGLPVASVTPKQELTAIDVTEALRNSTSPTVTFRFRLNGAGLKDGERTFVNIATMESGRPENRPALKVVVPETATPTTQASTTTVKPTPTTQATTTTVKPTPTTQATTTTVKPTTTTQPGPSGWGMVWSDEFNGSALDTSKWGFDAGTFGDGNKELACMTSSRENVDVSGGTLKIRAHKESGGYPCYNETRRSEFPDGRPYTSGAINSSGKFSTANARFEMRAKLPAGKGFWPAFWMTSQSYPFGGNGASGELDVFEVFGQTPTSLLTSAHWYYPSGSDCPSGRWGCSLLNKHTTVPNTSTGYHTYAIEWDNRSIKWFFDGQVVFEIGDGEAYKWASAAPKAGSFSQTYPAPFVPTNPMKLRINLAVGGTGPGAPDASTPFPGVFEVDYVRIYHR